MTQPLEPKDLNEGVKWEKEASKEDVAQLYADWKNGQRLLRTIFPVAWNADRGRDNMDLTLAYADVVRVLGITQDELKKIGAVDGSGMRFEEVKK